MLGACLPQRRLLPDLRYLQLLLANPKYMPTEIGNLIAMRLKRAHSPHTDVELPYHPITLALFQVNQPVTVQCMLSLLHPMYSMAQHSTCVVSLHNH